MSRFIKKQCIKGYTINQPTKLREICPCVLAGLVSLSSVHLLVKFKGVKCSKIYICLTQVTVKDPSHTSRPIGYEVVASYLYRPTSTHPGCLYFLEFRWYPIQAGATLETWYIFSNPPRWENETMTPRQAIFILHKDKNTNSISYKKQTKLEQSSH